MNIYIGGTERLDNPEPIGQKGENGKTTRLKGNKEMVYAVQRRRRASVIPTSLVSNSYRPTAVVRVKARRSQLQAERNLGTREGGK